MKKPSHILISNNEVVVFYDTLSEDKKKEVALILSAHNFNTNLLEKVRVFKIPRFLLINTEKIDMAKIIGGSIGIYSLHEQSKRVVPAYPEKLFFSDIFKRSTSFASFLDTNRQEIISALMNYETYHVANDEIDRAIDLFKSLDENSDYYQRRVGNIVAFLPRNQPLYALSCFALALSYMSRDVFVHVPSAMKFFFPLLEKKLDLKSFFPNVILSYEERRELLDNRSRLDV